MMGTIADGGVWAADEKRRIVAESFELNASVAVVARRHGINANLLFTWRQRFGSVGPVDIIPVTIASENAPVAPAAPSATCGRIEIVLDEAFDTEVSSRIIRRSRRE